MKKSLVKIANEQVPLLTALKWCEVASTLRERRMTTDCPACGQADVLRVYGDRGYCFNERRQYRPVDLLAVYWKMDAEHAAVKALSEVGYVPVGYAYLWDQAIVPPEPNRDMLAASLTVWCAARSRDWAREQYEPAVANMLARCLALLAKVHTDGECTLWREKCKEAMGKVLPPLAELT